MDISKCGHKMLTLGHLDERGGRTLSTVLVTFIYKPEIFKIKRDFLKRN